MRSTHNSETDYSNSETDGYMCLHISTGYGHILLYHCIVDLKQSASYFSGENRLIEEKQRIAIWNLWPWQVTCLSPHSKERTLLKWEKGSWEGLSKQKAQGRNWESGLVTFHWLIYNSPSLAELSLGKKRTFFFFLLDSPIIKNESFLSDLLTLF